MGGVNKDKRYPGGAPIARASGKSLAVATSSYAGEIQDVFRGFDTARFLKSTLSALLFGDGNRSIWARMPSDNSSVVGNALSINSATKERMSNGCLESNRGRWKRIPC